MITVRVTLLRCVCLHRLSAPYRSVVEHQKVGLHHQSKLKLLVPSIGTFFTRLPLAEAFRYQDRQRFISSRRFVPPSFNDVRLILNTAQIMGVTASGPLDLATFDGDVTLYDDGKSLEPQNEVISRIIGKSAVACSSTWVDLPVPNILES
jgi:IMP and pyridine-specific 5'-nucleotidase